VISSLQVVTFYIYFLFVLLLRIPAFCPLFYLPGFQILINNYRPCNTSLLVNSDKTNKHWRFSFLKKKKRKISQPRLKRYYSSFVTQTQNLV
jgi:hypothetical protein